MPRRILALLVLAALPSFAHGQTVDETRCRSVPSIYTAPAYGEGTVTGLATDVVILTNRNGLVISRQSVAYWCVPGRPQVRQVVTHSGNPTQYSIRFNYAFFTNNHPLLQGGTVEVVRNGVVIDRDRLN